MILKDLKVLVKFQALVMKMKISSVKTAFEVFLVVALTPSDIEYLKIFDNYDHPFSLCNNNHLKLHISISCGRLS